MELGSVHIWDGEHQLTSMSAHSVHSDLLIATALGNQAARAWQGPVPWARKNQLTHYSPLERNITSSQQHQKEKKNQDSDP